MTTTSNATWTHTTSNSYDKPRAGIDLFNVEVEGSVHTAIYVRYTDGTRTPARTVFMGDIEHATTCINAWTSRGIVNDYRKVENAALPEPQTPSSALEAPAYATEAAALQGGRSVTATNLQSLALIAREFFTVKTRCRLSLPAAPEWVRDMVCQARGGMFQDDYRYSFALDALNAFAEADDDDAAYIEADTDAGDLLAWAASHSDRVGYCDTYMHLTKSRYTDLAQVLRCGQYTERAEILRIVRRALEAQAAATTAVAIA